MSSTHRSSFWSVIVQQGVLASMPDCLLGCLALYGLFGWLVFLPGAGGSFWQFAWLCGFGLFASQCGFYVYVSVLSLYV